MDLKKNTLMEISKEIVNQTLRQGNRTIFIFANFDACSTELCSRLEERKIQIDALEKDIDIDNFRKFLKEPQIIDMLKNYLWYLMRINILSANVKEKIIGDDINNYFAQIISNHYSDLLDDDTILAIKDLFEIIMNICSLKFNKSVYSSFIDMNNERIVISKYILEETSETKIFDRIVQKIKTGMISEFVLRNVRYEKVKTDYTKALKQFYQMGFIYLIGEYKFNDFYIPPILISGGKDNFFDRMMYRKKNNYEVLRANWEKIFDKNDMIYIVGGAGYGKSLFLKNIINNYSKLNIANSQDYLLVYCDLKSFYSNGNANKKTMLDFLQESMINISGIDTISKEVIQYYLNIGRCIILLDALDEVSKEMRGELHKKLICFFSTCNFNNKVCITSRDRGFIPQQDIEVMEILPLTVKDIGDYIEKMITLKKFKKEDKETFMKQARVLIEKNFLNNFLALSLLVNIYKSEKELPENKIDLYKKCFEYIAKKREEEKSKTRYNWKSMYPLMKDSTFISLSVLAAPNNKDIQREKVEELLLKQYKTKYSDEATTECAIKEFLDFCSDRTELFVPSSVDDKFKFFHRSFFEYFYSRYIHQRPGIEEMYALMAEFDIDSEVFELTVALVKEDNEEKYQSLIEYIFEKIDEEFKNENNICNAFSILTLAMQVIDDAYFIQKYYETVIKYSQLLTNSKIFSMNQKLLSMCLEKGIGEDAERQNKFKETYEKACVSYLFALISNIKDASTREEFYNLKEYDTASEIPIEMYFNHIFRMETRNIPFYIFVYNKYYSIYDMLEKYDKAKVNKSINPMPINRKEKNAIRKGFNNYMKLKTRDREYLIEALCKIS